MPFFTIIIPSYNRADFLPETIGSIQQQHFTDWECIVVDDGSADNTREVVNQLIQADPRIRYIYQDNMERSSARNNGVRNATGKYICFLDSDDRFLVNHLEVLKQEIDLRAQPTALFFTDHICLTDGELIKHEIPRMKEDQLTFMLQNAVIPARVCIHSEILMHEKFDEDIVVVEDVILWTRIAANYPVIQIPVETVLYSLHEENSINLKHNPGQKRLNGLRTFLKRYPAVRKKIPRTIEKKVVSDTLFTVAKHFMYVGNKKNALKYTLLSMLKNPFDTQTKHKLFVLIQLTLGKKIEQYT